jgi:hypothetical protein
MKLTELKVQLATHPELGVRFLLPSGEPVAAHAHVTEVARVDKRFIDCGGKLRTDATCRLQTWVADDTHHRLTAGKLLRILEKSTPVLQADDLELEVEHEGPILSQFPVTAIAAGTDALVLRLGTKHTACLAEDQCKRPPPLAHFLAHKPFAVLK